MLVSEDQYRFVCKKKPLGLTLIIFLKKVKSSGRALQVADKRIEVNQKERKPFVSSPFLAGFLLLFVVLSVTLPSTAGATVAAYLDGQGKIHYVRGKNDRANKFTRIYQGKTNSRVARPSKNSSSQTINAFIQAAASEHGVDPLLIKAIIKTESNFDTAAVSPKGAQGLMQLMPATAKDLEIVDPFDPLENIAGGTKYLRSLLDSYGWDLELSLAAYNAGPGKVKGAVPNIRETKFYVSRVIGNYQSYQNNR